MSNTETVVNAEPVIDERGWRQELEQLDRLLSGRLTKAEAKEYAKAELARHDGIVHTIETQIAQAKAALNDTPFLSTPDRNHIAASIESLEDQLEDARRLREQSIRKNGAAIRDSKAIDELRPRWEQLRERERAIDAAKKAGSNREPELGISVARKWA